MQALEIVAVFFFVTFVCVALDSHCRYLAARRLRRSLHAEAQSYLIAAKRI